MELSGRLLQVLHSQVVEAPFRDIDTDLADLSFQTVWNLRREASSFREKLDRVLNAVVLDHIEPQTDEFVEISRLGTDILIRIGEEIKRQKGETYYKSRLLNASMAIQRQLDEGAAFLQLAVWVWGVGQGILIPPVISPIAKIMGIVNKVLIGVVDEKERLRKRLRKQIKGAPMYKIRIGKDSGQLHTKLPYLQNDEQSGHR